MLVFCIRKQPAMHFLNIFGILFYGIFSNPKGSRNCGILNCFMPVSLYPEIIFLFESHLIYVPALKLANFYKSQPSKLFKSCLFLFIEEKLSLQPKSNICNFRWKECCCQYVLLKITLLHLELKIFDYGGNGIYASINLEFASCVVNDKCILAEGN